MRHWASTIPNAQFLEVCVESEAVALHFHRTYGFGENHYQYSSKPEKNINTAEEESLPPVINGWIPSRHYMPVGYGQLGCSGFIIADAHGKFVSRKTAAYLQYGDQAFRHVESILADLLVETANEQPKGEAPAASTMERVPPEVSPQRQNDRKKQKKSEGDDSRGSPTTVVQAPSSVGVESMDEEHQICTDSFNRALKDPTFEALQEIFELLKSHFAHEEDLIAKYAITPEQANSQFSALASHKKDHFRILSIAVVELQRLTNLHNAGAGGCAEVSGQKV